ncbi:imidazolonepropionase [Flavipsychrobacter stenotrophus]|uniref:Imidazolonepropionase n=1 Tax=Flavipsychrobacter stenotrophus TaxID=2077091 RepID=A0A2S7SRM1_9BACT|nr:imidazolonepropionase [Flavipsychrobacter stenotrophus]PQJ09255.1 imidazolonepropionase [Flavipsychrobacter stenotrophus]
MCLLITNIKQLCQVELSSENKKKVSGKDMAVLPSIDNAWLLVEGELIHSFGEMATMPEMQADEIIDATGRLVLPTWCDSHTHLVFAAPRDGEFVNRLKGVSYEEIARQGGGILNSARKLNEMSESELHDQSLVRLHNVIGQGTGAIEIKSGYGLCEEGELKMLRVIRKLKENSPVAIKASFLAAHAYPVEYKENKEGYIKLIIEKMLPRVAGEGLADYMDMFCEQGFFGVPECERLMEAGWKYGLKPKIHANQLHFSGGVQAGVKHKAISVDHLECVGDEEIASLMASETMPTLLPGAAFFLGMHYQPARKIIDAGLPVCLATDYNPGSCPSGNVPLLLSISCTQLKMTPEETINAVTLNGAAAMELEGTYGTIKAGKVANLIITKPIPSLSYIPYDYGNGNVDKVVLKGKWA